MDYAHDSTGTALRRRGIRHAIPERRDQIAHRAGKGSGGAPPTSLRQAVHKQRNVVERCFAGLKQRRNPGPGRASLASGRAGSARTRGAFYDAVFKAVFQYRETQHIKRAEESHYEERNGARNSAHKD